MISIIIPTLNAEKQLYELLKALASQTVQFEIIVIDSSSSDNTVQIAEAFGARVIIIKREEFDHSGSRTIAGNEAKGNILIYLTQDAVPVDKYAVEKLIKPFEDKHVGVAFGRQLPKLNASLFSAHSRLFNYPMHSYVRSIEDKEKYKIKTAYLSNSFSAYRKETLEKIGGFKKDLISTEDTYAGAKLLLAGYKIAYISDAMVYHSHNYTIFQEFKRYFDIGVFHRKEKWIMEEFGKAEGEGIRYIRSEAGFLLKNKKYHLFPEFFVRNLFKYAGFVLGRHFEKIPENIVKKLSMNTEWWNRKC